MLSPLPVITLSGSQRGLRLQPIRQIWLVCDLSFHWTWKSQQTCSSSRQALCLIQRTEPQSAFCYFCLTLLWEPFSQPLILSPDDTCGLSGKRGNKSQSWLLSAVSVEVALIGCYRAVFWCGRGFKSEDILPLCCWGQNHCRAQSFFQMETVVFGWSCYFLIESIRFLGEAVTVLDWPSVCKQNIKHSELSENWKYQVTFSYCLQPSTHGPTLFCFLVTTFFLS